MQGGGKGGGGSYTDHAERLQKIEGVQNQNQTPENEYNMSSLIQ